MEPDEAADLLGELSLADQEYVLTTWPTRAEVRLQPPRRHGRWPDDQRIPGPRPSHDRRRGVTALRTWRPDAEKRPMTIYVVDQFGAVWRGR